MRHLNKKATLLPVKALISIIITVIMVVVFVAFVTPLLFGGPQYTTFNDLYDTIEDACQQGENYNYQFSLFVPDSTGTNKLNIRFYYFVIEDSKLKLKSRSYFEEYPNDWPPGTMIGPVLSIVERVALESQITAVETERERELKHCRNIQICAVESTTDTSKHVCDNFAFEANTGKEMMTFIFLKAPALSQDYKGTLFIAINKETICGDGRCCGDEGDSTKYTLSAAKGWISGGCPSDCCAKSGSTYICATLKPCTIFAS